VGWIRKTFLYREDYVPALQGLKGLAVLWFFHLSFYSQFDQSKLSRITEGRPWMAGALDALLVLLSPSLMAPLAVLVLGGFLAARSIQARPLPELLLSRLLRFYPVFLAAVLPTLVYSGADWSKLGWAMTFFLTWDGIPAGDSILLARAFWLPLLWAVIQASTRRSAFPVQAALFLAAAGLDFLVYRDPRTTSAYVAVLLGAAAARHGAALPRLISRSGAGPCLLLALVLTPFFASGAPLPSLLLSNGGSILLALATASLAASSLSVSARILSHPFLRYFGAVALPFFLVHTTWGFRLSRSILQGEIHSVGAIAAHYAMSICFSIAAAGFLHVFFERPRFLRNAPSADKTPSSATQGVFP